MRAHGTLTRWNDARGFGFITPSQGTDELFVHISAFPRDGIRPQIDELVSFETEPGKDGKLRAVRVMRPASRPNRPSRPQRQPRPERKRRTGIGWVAGALMVVSGGLFSYSKIMDLQQSGVQSTVPLERVSSSTSAAHNESTFRCDGRQHCSQMNSCAEARFFLQNCPNTQMDGDQDGRPCERDVCSSR